MSKKDEVYVFSTLTSSVEYRNHVAGGADLPVVDKSVLIVGGTNLPDKHLITPYGVMTKVSAEDISWLQENELFKLHQKNGYITVRDKAADPEKVATDMKTRDESAPLVDADFKEGEKPANVDKDAAPAGGKNSRRA